MEGRERDFSVRISRSDALAVSTILGRRRGGGGEGERTIGDNEVSLNVSADKRAFAF